MAFARADAAETDEQRFLRELRRLLAEPDDVEVQSEGEQEQKRQQQLDNDPSIEATRNLLRACQEAQGVGLRTVTVLESQGEQLDNVERALEKLSADLDSVESHLSEMRRPIFWFCPWRCRWKKKKKQHKNQGEKVENKSNKRAKNNSGHKLRLFGAKASSKEIGEPSRSKTSSRSDSVGSEPARMPAAGGHRGSASLGPQKEQRSQHPDDQLGAALTDLKGIAQSQVQRAPSLTCCSLHKPSMQLDTSANAEAPPLSKDMGERLSTQNEQIDRLTVSATSSEERLRQDSQRAGEILRDA